MSKNSKNEENLFSKVVNTFLTIIIAFAISSPICNAENNNLRIAQISDIHFSSYEKNTSYKFLEKSGELLDDAIFQLNTSGPYDFVIFTGDLINQPQISELENVIHHISKLHYSWYAIDGNHDISVSGELTKNRFIEILNQHNIKIPAGNIYYAFTPKKGFRVLCLDSIIDYKITCNGEFPPKEVEWIKEEIKSHPDSVIIIATHVPIYEPFSSPSHRLKNANEMRVLLNSYPNIFVVLQGHYHGTKARQENNVVYISTPSLVTYPNAFRVINIHSDKKKVSVDVFFKSTNIKDIITRSKMRLMGSEKLAGNEEDKNITIEIKKE